MLDAPAHLIEKLDDAERVVFLTGSGVSAESGVPTFRDHPEGLWARYRPEELATPEAFQDDPALVWGWYQWRRELIRKVEPNPGHVAIAGFQATKCETKLITQNVDGLHQRAGSRNPIEYHGNLFRERCTEDCGLIQAVKHDPLPTCPGCGALARPDVVWFGEAIDPINLETAAQMAADCELFFSVGTSSLVWPAAGLAQAAASAGALIVEINPADTPCSEIADFRFAGPAGEIVPRLLAA